MELHSKEQFRGSLKCCEHFNVNRNTTFTITDVTARTNKRLQLSHQRINSHADVVGCLDKSGNCVDQSAREKSIFPLQLLDSFATWASTTLEHYKAFQNTKRP